MCFEILCFAFFYAVDVLDGWARDLGGCVRLGQVRLGYVLWVM